MNAILKMIYSSDQAKVAIKLCKKKNLMIVNKKHGLALDDEIGPCLPQMQIGVGR